MARAKSGGGGGGGSSGRGKKGAKKGEERKKGKRGEGPGLMSSAGLMRYYDVEESAIKISPMTVLFIGILFGVIVLIFEIIYGVWPPP